jgi:hypothetical protein
MRLASYCPGAVSIVRIWLRKIWTFNNTAQTAELLKINICMKSEIVDIHYSKQGLSIVGVEEY